MSTNPQTTTEPQPTTASTTDSTATSTTAIEARGRADPWSAPGETVPTPTERTQRQFEPTCRKRLRNLVDKENAYCE